MTSTTRVRPARDPAPAERPPQRAGAVLGPGGRRGASPMASRLVVVVGVALIGLYFLLPGDTSQNLMYSAFGIVATAVMLWGILVRKPAERWGWCCLALANTCFVLGDATYTVYDLVLHRETPFPSVADALYLAGYPFLFWGVLRISRPGKRPGARDVWADAAMVSVGVLALSWQFLMSPYAHDATLSRVGMLVTLAYPIMDIAVLFIVISAMMTGTARRTSDQLLALSIVVMLVADFVYDILVLHETYTTGNPVDGAFLLNYVLLAAAAVHPSVAHRAPAAVGAASTRAWLPLVAVAAFVSPVILLVGTLFHRHVDVPVLATTSMALITLGVLRGAWLVRRLRAQADQLRERGESLQTALATQQTLEADLRHEAFHDSLTGLANRALLHDRVEHALEGSTRRRGSVAVCFCDLDGFKGVNDSLGHGAGDDLLTVVAKRLSLIVRPGDTVARLGGDEFAILIENVDSVEAIETLADRIVSSLHQPITVDDQEIYISASVGIAFAGAGSTSEILLSEADAAMYAAKAAGKNRYTVFESVMRSRIVDRMTLINSFADALQRGEFRLEYQPQHRLSDGSLEGFEALVRWEHPELGLVGPDRFIPLAEETGFIVPLGRWILEQACLQAAEWPLADGIDGPLVTVSVNLSGRQLQNANLLQDVATALSFSGLRPERLVLEVTETVLMSDPISAADLLAELRNLGIRIAIDDFGTGYSALSYLQQLPVDILKIDKSFVDPLGMDGDDDSADAFVRTILRLARDLDLDVTAEGIERQAQRDVLTALDCHAIQGFLMSRPLANDAARAYIAAGGARPAAHAALQ